MHVHLIAICGVGMAPLAVLFKRAGHRVTGSDSAAFPPMSEVLASAGITIEEGFEAAHVSASRPDLVIVGNAVPSSNVEAHEVERLGLERRSFPQALAEFFLAGHRSLVVTGTHGKTTTTGMLAAALEEAGEKPGYLIGGLVRDLGEFSRAGSGGYFVVEGDEYDCAYFDKRPKFLHYQPFGAIVTSIEFDHADIYRDLTHVRSAFREFASLVPAAGPLVVCGDGADVVDTLAPIRTLITYGLGAGNDWTAEPVGVESGRVRARIRHHGKAEDELVLSLFGDMNVLNALAVYALCRELGVARDGVKNALARYRGAARRQEILGEAAGVVVIDDFAHHPTAVAATLAAIRSRFPGRLLRAVFEPRSNTSRRAVFQQAYASALAGADRVALSAVYAKPNDPLGAEEMLSTDRLVADLAAAGVAAWTAAGPEEILERLLGEIAAGEVVVCMSNGAFGGLPRRLLAALGERSGARVTV